MLGKYALIGMMLLPVAANAATITESDTAPTGSTISQSVFDGTVVTSRDRSDISGTPSQTFTTGDIGFELDSLTIKGGNNAGGFAVGGSYFVLTLRTATNTDSGSTSLISQEISQAFTPASATSYLTFTLATPLDLDPDTIYAYDIYTTDSTTLAPGGTGGSFYAFAKSATDTLVDGVAFQNGFQTPNNKRFSADPGRFDTVQNGTGPQTNSDRTFFLNGAAVPEPSSVALMGVGLGGVCLFALRRRTA